MNYMYFLAYNVVGGIVWVSLFTLVGFLFGNLPFIQHNFSLVVIVIVLLSLVPPIMEYWKHKKEAKQK